MGLVISSEFVRKKEFELKDQYIRNMNTVEVNIYYQGDRERTEISVIGGQKWSVILEMLWLTHYNSEIN